MQMMILRIFMVVFSALTSIICNAQTPGNKGFKVDKPNTVFADSGRIFGIVIGVSAYESLPGLKYADIDAEYFYNYLKSAVKASDSRNISLFLNKRANRDIVTEKLYAISDSVKKGDKVFIYFGGHGDIEHITQTDNCLLLLGDAPAKNYLRKSASYLDINLFRDFFSTWSAKEVKTFFICDACHSGKLSGGDVGRKNTLLSLQQSWKNEVNMLSCQPDELSLEGDQWGGGRGLFSYFLIAGLQGLADKNKDSLVTLFEVQNYVRDSVTIHSEQSQIPVFNGDIKSVVGKYTKYMFTEAKISLKPNTFSIINDQAGLAFKGNEEADIERTIRDSSKRVAFRQFMKYLKQKNLTGSNSQNAMAVFLTFPDNEEFRIAKGYMKLQLLAALQSDFDTLTEYLYNDNYDKFDFTRRYEIEKYMKAALKITGKNHPLYKKIKSGELFLVSCNALPEIQTGVVITNQIKDKLLAGIDTLKKAVLLNPIAPFLHLRLGDFYLYSGRFSEAIDAYTIYTQLLPNDEYAYNKLGMAYYLSGNANSAVPFFRKALSINPAFYKAQENLSIAVKAK
ncbi:MAG: caspase family protein [Sphingobacteriales bacterium]|nr:caspase family protein [Sphingobacteriales bacterium]